MGQCEARCLHVCRLRMTPGGNNPGNFRTPGRWALQGSLKHSKLIGRPPGVGCCKWSICLIVDTEVYSSGRSATNVARYFGGEGTLLDQQYHKGWNAVRQFCLGFGRAPGRVCAACSPVGWCADSLSQQGNLSSFAYPARVARASLLAAAGRGGCARRLVQPPVKVCEEFNELSALIVPTLTARSGPSFPGYLRTDRETGGNKARKSGARRSGDERHV